MMLNSIWFSNFQYTPLWHILLKNYDTKMIHAESSVIVIWNTKQGRNWSFCQLVVNLGALGVDIVRKVNVLSCLIAAFWKIATPQLKEKYWDLWNAITLSLQSL